MSQGQAMDVLEEFSTVTAKGQTTVPKAIRQALGVGYGGRIVFRVEGGDVILRAAPAKDDEQDTALIPFLDLLKTDMSARPAESIQPLPTELMERLARLIADIGTPDPNDGIEGEVEL